ncbi:MAG: glutathione S-transferase N-terminal domain-containing protein [Fretibacterium sp.]|nr:glutathione S-transferase N-terminal domain-containing protein [Fretibacterium sp.]
MKKVTFFYLEKCPYCRQARRALDELKVGDARYGTAEITWVEESQHPDVAEKYDYYNVPAMFVGDEKLYEAKPGEKYEDCRENVKRVLDAALA